MLDCKLASTTGIFYNGTDTNNTGNVLYQTMQDAQNLGLISLNSAGNTIIKVDNTTSGVGNSNLDARA